MGCVGVQISLPLSLGLLGTLSIIRFRTPIKEPEETGFLVLVIAAAIICATFNFLFLIILYAIAGVMLYVRNRGVHKEKGDGMLVLVLSDEEALPSPTRHRCMPVCSSVSMS
ncbi:MAG: DUF4956 domain-containing protein [Kiritimatiellae bacterium]|nr:DUF4956 domain-containing protein [Kiritimatiellia bacterium]